MRLLNAVLIEYRIDLRRRLRYRFSFMGDTAIFIGLFLAIVLLNREGEGLALHYGVSAPLGGPLMLLGYSFWQMSSTALGFGVWVVEGEAASGMLEVKLASPTPVPLLLFARLISSGLTMGVVTQVSVVAVAVLAGIMPPRLLLSYLAAMLLYLPSLGGMFGMGCLLSSLALRFKRLGQLTVLVQSAMLMLTEVGGGGSSLLRLLLPYGGGIDLARRVLLGLPIEKSSMLAYLLTNLLWLLAGVGVFSGMVERNRKKGVFTAY